MRRVLKPCLLFLLIALFALVLNGALAAGADRTMDFQLIDQITITQENGAPLPNPVPRNLRFKLTYHFSVPNTLLPNLSTGDYYLLDIPIEVPIPADGPFDLLMGSVKLAQWEVLPGNQIKVTFSENAAGLSNRVGTFWMNLGFDSSAIGGGGLTKLTFDVGNGQSQDKEIIFEPPAKTPPEVLKTGKYLKDTNEIQWSITINPKGQSYSKLVIRDTIPENTAFVPGSFTWDNGSVFPPGITAKLEGDIIKLESNLVISSTKYFGFKTKVLDSAFADLTNGGTTMIDNQAIVGYDGGSVHTNLAQVPVSVVYASKTGSHNNVTKKITWTVVVNPQGQHIQNATFSDLLPNGLTYVPNSLKKSVDGGAFTVVAPVTVSGQTLSASLGNLDRPVKLMYETTVSDALYTGGTHNLTNKVTIGQDGGPPGESTATATVSVSGGNNIVKTGPAYSSSTTYPAGYDPATGTINWSIRVNGSSLTLENPQITDVLDDTTHDLVQNSVSVTGLPSGVSYTVTYNGVRGFTVNVQGTVTAPFTITLKTKLVSPNYFENNYVHPNANNMTWPKNSATLKVGTLEQTSTAVSYIRSLVLQKAADSAGFDYQTHELKYNLTVNRNRNDLKDVVVTEKLGKPLLFKPGSLRFAGGAAISDVVGTKPYYVYTATPADPVYSGTLEIHLGDVSTTQSLELVGYIDDTDPESVAFLSKPGDKKLINDATLKHLRLPGGTPQVHVETVVKTSVVEKTGSSPANSAFIDWKVLINKASLEMDGFTLSDTLAHGLEMDTTTLRLTKVTVNANGSIKEEGDIPLSPDDITFDFATQSFSLKLPETGQLQEGAYQLSFRTYVTGSEVGNYTNAATLRFGATTVTSPPATVRVQWNDAGGSAWGEVGVLTVHKTEDGKPAIFIGGAKFALYDRLGIQVAELVTDENGTAHFDRLRFDIPYTLKEIEQPLGYVLDESEQGKQTFTLPSSDPDKKMEILVENTRVGGYQDRTAIKVWENWPENIPLPTVYLRLMWRLEDQPDSAAVWVPAEMLPAPDTVIKQPVFDPATQEWKATWAKLPNLDLAGKAYVYLAREVDQNGEILVPNAAQQGYVSSTSGLTVTNATVPSKLTFSKTAVNGTAELPGAALKVYEGETADETKLKTSWTSTDTPHTFELTPGTYTMVETTAPFGYEIAESITFRVNLDGSVDIQENGKWEPAQNATVKMEDAFTPRTITFSKTAVNGTAELPGAKLEVYEGEVADETKLLSSWTSTTTPHTFELTPGTYTMVETTAPAGYEIAESITFRVNLDGSVDIKQGTDWVPAQNATVKMEDAHTPVPETPVYATLNLPLIARKTLKNGSLKAGEFTFVLKDSAGRVLAEAVNDKSGLVTFPDRTFSRAVTNYLYTIEEKAGSNRNIRYDGTKYTLKVTTWAVDGVLKAKVDLEKDGVPYAGQVQFTNVRKAPATGDGTMRLLLILFASSLLLLGASTLIYLKKKRRS